MNDIIIIITIITVYFAKGSTVHTHKIYTVSQLKDNSKKFTE